MKNLVIGLGEVGSAVREVLGCDGHDPYKGIHAEGKYDVVHICIPCGDVQDFIATVKTYQASFGADLTIIHSTVPVGTSRQCNAVHSPIRGVHPHLAEGIRTFVKFFGGARAQEAAVIFESIGITCHVTDKPENTEAAKLWCTTGYGLNLILEKDIHAYCKEHGLDFTTVYTMFNETYNTGYQQLNMPQFQKYNVSHYPGKIGGHCVIPNAHLLNSAIAKYVVERNNQLTNE